MDFDELREILCGLDEKENPKCGIGLVYGVPMENEEGEFELLPSDVVTLKKPEVSFAMVADPMHSEDFLRVNLRFPSMLDSDMEEICEILDVYQREVDAHAEDPLSCPTMTLFLIPSTLNAGNKFYFECDFPLLISYTSSSPKHVPDTISFLFFANECHVLDELGFEMEDLEKDLREEEQSEARIAYEQDRRERIQEEEERKKQERLKRLSLQDEPASQSDRVIRVGRQD